MDVYCDLDEIINREDYEMLYELRRRWRKRKHLLKKSLESKQEKQSPSPSSPSSKSSTSDSQAEDPTLEATSEPIDVSEMFGSKELQDSVESDVHLDDAITQTEGDIDISSPSSPVINDETTTLNEDVQNEDTKMDTECQEIHSKQKPETHPLLLSHFDELLNWDNEIIIPEHHAKILPQKKDGNCLFSSIAQWLKKKGNKYSVQNLIPKRNIKPPNDSNVEMLKSLSSEFIVNNNKKLIENNYITDEDVQYAESYKEPGHWGDFSNIIVLSILLRTPIVVWKKADGFLSIEISTFSILQNENLEEHFPKKLNFENEDKVIIHVLYGKSHYDTVYFPLEKDS